MSEEADHWGLKLFREAKASPGFWAILCLGLALISAGVLLVDHFKQNAFAAMPEFPVYAILGVLVGGVSFLGLGILHLLNRPPKLPPPIPDFQTPTLAKPELIAVINRKPGEQAVTYEPAKLPQVQQTVGPRAKDMEAILGANRPRVPRDAATGEIAAAPPKPVPDLDPRNRTNRAIDAEVERLRRRAQEETSPQAKKYLEWIATRESDEVWADPQDPTVEELVLFGLLQHSGQGSNTKRLFYVNSIVRQAIVPFRRGQPSKGAQPPWTTYERDYY